jgi:hypothetical protein
MGFVHELRAWAANAHARSVHATIQGGLEIEGSSIKAAIPEE